MILKNGLQFFKEVRIELSRVVWPKWDEFVGSTVIVIFLVIVSALYLGFFDLLFSRLAWFIFSRYIGH